MIDELEMIIDEEFPDIDDSDKREVYLAMKDDYEEYSYQTTDHSEGDY